MSVTIRTKQQPSRIYQEITAKIQSPLGSNSNHLELCLSTSAGMLDFPTLPPKPLPPNPRYVINLDCWDRQQTGMKALESVATISDRFGLVLVMPNVRMSNIQGIPGWTQWRSTHALGVWIHEPQCWQCPLLL